MKPLLNTKQLRGLISDHVGKKIEIIFNILLALFFYILELSELFTLTTHPIPEYLKKKYTVSNFEVFS